MTAILSSPQWIKMITWLFEVDSAFDNLCDRLHLSGMASYFNGNNIDCWKIACVHNRYHQSSTLLQNYHCHFSNITWAPWHPKLLGIRLLKHRNSILFAGREVQGFRKQFYVKSHGVQLNWTGGLTAQKASNADKAFMGFWNHASNLVWRWSRLSEVRQYDQW